MVNLVRGSFRIISSTACFFLLSQTDVDCTFASRSTQPMLKPSCSIKSLFSLPVEDVHPLIRVQGECRQSTELYTSHLRQDRPRLLSLNLCMHFRIVSHFLLRGYFLHLRLLLLSRWQLPLVVANVHFPDPPLHISSSFSSTGIPTRSR